MTDESKAREFWINGNEAHEFDSSKFPVVIDRSFLLSDSTVRVIEYSAYEKVKKALRDTANGRPSEWAYTILKKDYDEAQAQLSARDARIKELEELLGEAVEALHCPNAYYTGTVEDKNREFKRCGECDYCDDFYKIKSKMGGGND